MQYTRPPQFPITRSQAHRNGLFVLLAAVFVIVACISLSLSAPTRAYAKSYEMPQVDIQAQLETDGTLHVVEQRTFDFDGSFSSVWWTMNLLPSNAEFSVNSVRMMSVDDSNAVEGSMTTLSEVPFDLKWREKDGPGKDAYSIDSPKDTVYVFFGDEPKRVVIELDYTITNMAQLYDDVAEVYWRYVGSSWSADSENVTASLQLPLPQSATVEPGENVHAWGHGPLEGEVSVNADGSIVCKVPKIGAGEYAELRALVPTSWLSNTSLKAQRLHAGEQRLDTVLKEEKEWADTANSRRMMSFGFSAACALMCVAVLAWALICFLRYGKEYKPDFTGKYFDKLPQKELHPALIGRLWRWNRESEADLTATIMHLQDIGAVRIGSGSYQVAEGAAEKKKRDVCITKLVSESELSDPIDRETFKLLFDCIGEGQGSVWLGSVSEYSKNHSQALVDGMKHWQAVLSEEVAKRGFFEEEGQRLRRWIWIATIILLVLMLGMWPSADNMLPVMMGVPTAVAMVFIGNNMPRRSEEGNNIVARCKALRNWLRDFGALDGKVPADEKTWSELMILAYLFGVSDRAVDQLRAAQGQLFAHEGAMMASRLPWWCWYWVPPVDGNRSQQNVASFVTSSFESGINVASEALQVANGGLSSAAGAGGGFSAGGGGGFGAGGGGAR